MAAMVGGFSEPKDIAFSAEMAKEEFKDTTDAVPPKDPKEEQHDDDDKEEDVPKSDLSPQPSLKGQIEKDHDNESLKKWEEKPPTSVDISTAQESKETEVKVLSLSIVSPGRTDQVLPLPFVPNSKGTLFTLKEGSRFRLKFCFSVCNNVVSGFTYTNTVWRAGIRVDSRKVKLGSYTPREDHYSYEFEEETIPTGMFARGSYSARTKFVDDDGKCYLDARYRFEIQKNWSS